MTVQELIDYLSKFDKNLPVKVCTPDAFIAICEDHIGYVGTPDKAEYLFIDAEILN